MLVTAESEFRDSLHFIPLNNQASQQFLQGHSICQIALEPLKRNLIGHSGHEDTNSQMLQQKSEQYHGHLRETHEVIFIDLLKFRIRIWFFHSQVFHCCEHVGTFLCKTYSQLITFFELFLRNVVAFWSIISIQFVRT